MAKFGKPEQGGYDPFNSISDSLSALQEPPQEVVEAEPERQEAPPPPASKPEPAPAPRPEPMVEVRESGGGVPVGQGINTPTGTVSAASALKTTKRFKTTREEALRLDQSVLRLAERLGVYTDVSKITRALWEAYLRHEDDILRNIPSDNSLVRPANNDAVGMAEFDEKLADLISDGFMVASMRPRNSR